MDANEQCSGFCLSYTSPARLHVFLCSVELHLTEYRPGSWSVVSLMVLRADLESVWRPLDAWTVFMFTSIRRRIFVRNVSLSHSCLSGSTKWERWINERMRPFCLLRYLAKCERWHFSKQNRSKRDCLLTRLGNNLPWSDPEPSVWWSNIQPYGVLANKVWMCEQDEGRCFCKALARHSLDGERVGHCAVCAFSFFSFKGEQHREMKANVLALNWYNKWRCGPSHH